MVDGFIDYYVTLDFEDKKHFDPDQLKSNYRQQAMRYHPDRNHEKDAQERMQDINEAFHVLSDPRLKKMYDTIYDEYQETKIKEPVREERFKPFDDFRKAEGFDELVRLARHQTAEIVEETNRAFRDIIVEVNRQARDLTTSADHQMADLIRQSRR